jgi:hypothetical protein
MTTPSALLVDLAACIDTTLADEGRPPVCFTGVIPGDGVAAAWGGDCSDVAGCGMAWVRLVTAYPSATLGQADQSAGNCGAALGLDIEVGILRCTPVDTEDAETEEIDALATSIGILDDMLILKKAIQCCTALPTKDLILGGWTPMGPLGGLVGGAWLLYAAV